ncbi:TMV resistance protein N [Theobroma cacao]|uniref:ADP-ribosyl cyclase/cyclic ADP-ribose hydrolase n=1 Tax=Theobroma cacao TaxID=3641 RepID=A0A061EZ11_THECC|nr:TMV resistance protein N [Theobroma cacao]
MAVSMVHHQEFSLSDSQYTYDVLLSFRGTDTRKNFTDHLYMALVQARIHTFRDADEIGRGENIKNEIERAIYESKISIIVFSKIYASSTWCLNELVKIMKHRKFSKHIVLPIFYGVNPSQVKKQTGSFAEAFARHEESFKSEMDMVQRWRAALRDVADLEGMLLEDGLFDDVMPSDLSYLPSLKSLNLSRNPIHSFPESIIHLTKLDELLLTCCKELKWLPMLPTSDLHVIMSQLLYKISSLPCLLNLKRCVVFGCEKLTEVQGVFMLKPIENFEVEQIKSLFTTDSIRSTELQIYNYLTDTKMVFHDSSITSCFVSRSEVPILFEYRSQGFAISFSLPQNPSEKVSWLNLCIVYSLVSDEIFEFLPSVHIVNETKKLTCSYLSSFIGIPETNSNTILWLIHWPVMDYQLENGDLVSCKLSTFSLNIREFGVTCVSKTKVMYEDDTPQYSQENEDIWREIELKDEELLKLGSSENIKVQIYNDLEESTMIASPKFTCHSYDLSEDTCSRHANHAIGNKVSFVVARSSGQHIGYLKLVAILYAEEDNIFDFLSRIEIVNKTKDSKWIFYKHFIGIPKVKNNIYWFSLWRFMDELEDGDQVNCTVFSNLSVNRSTVDLEYEPDDDLLHKCNSGYQHLRGHTPIVDADMDFSFDMIGIKTVMIVPFIYVTYEDQIKRCGEKVKDQLRRLYEMFDEKVIRKMKNKSVKEKDKEKKLKLWL